MRIIKEADKTILKVWPAGRPEVTVYRLPAYTITAEVEDGLLLLNTVTGELLFLDDSEKRQLSSLPCDYSARMDELIQKHFLVKTDSDDKKTVDTLRLAMRLLNASHDITGYVILPTTGCNARCFYCYQAGWHSENMSDETADKLVDFMDSHHGGKPLNLSWFGGEPLVGIRQIRRICRMLKEREIPFTSAMTSNASLFTAETIREAREGWNLASIQVTLDGTEKVYNETKAYLSSNGNPFRIVLNNIDLLLQNDIRVCIRLNMGIHNADDLTVLAEDLATRYQNQPKLEIYCNLLFNDCGYLQTHYDKKQLSLLSEKRKLLDEKICAFAPMAYKMALPKLLTNRCMADNDSSLIVTPSGMFGKCEHTADSELIGSLETGITDKEAMQRLREPVIYPECAECPLYPSCIRLKPCAPADFCGEIKTREIIDKVVRNMRQNYRAFLAAEQQNEEAEKTTN